MLGPRVGMPMRVRPKGRLGRAPTTFCNIWFCCDSFVSSAVRYLKGYLSHLQGCKLCRDVDLRVAGYIEAEATQRKRVNGCTRLR